MSSIRSKRNRRVATMDRRFQEVAMEGFRLALFLMLLCRLGMVQVKATEKRKISPRGGDEREGRQARSRSPRIEALVEALVKQARTARHPWLIACDANMNPEDCRKEPMVQKQKHVH